MEEFPECVQNLLKREQNGIFSVLHQIISLKSKEDGHMHSWHLRRQYIDYTRLDIILRYFIASGRKHYIEEKR